MSIAKRLQEEQMDLTCSECGEEFPEYLRNAFIARGLREAAKIMVGAKDPEHVTLADKVIAVHARIKELEGPHGEFLS